MASLSTGVYMLILLKNFRRLVVAPMESVNALFYRGVLIVAAGSPSKRASRTAQRVRALTYCHRSLAHTTNMLFWNTLPITRSDRQNSAH
jgi:hypothetical protein